MQKQYKIAIDTKGADKGATMIIRGAVEALKKYQHLSVLLVGDEEIIQRECESLGAPCERIEILNAPDEITNYDSPAMALFEKPESSLVKALSATAEREDVGERHEVAVKFVDAVSIIPHDRKVRGSWLQICKPLDDCI